MAGRHRFDAFGGKTDVQQGHALAGRGEQGPLNRVAQRLDPQRIPGHHHVAQRVDEHDAVGAVELAGEVAAKVQQLWPPLRGQRPANLVHQHFGIRLAGEVVVVIVEQLLAEVHEVGQLPVKGEAKPLVLLDVMAFERLGVAAIVLAAGGVADVTDGRPTGVLLHQVFVLAPVVEAKDLAHVPHFLVGVDELVSIGIIGGHAGGQLAAVLDVQEHPRHEPRDFFGTLLGTQRADAPVRQMIDSHNAAFFVEIAHGIVFYGWPLRFTIHLSGGARATRCVSG